MRWIKGMTCLLCLQVMAACSSDEEWTRQTNYENCADISVPGYSPNEIQVYVIDVVKPAFAGQPGVTAFASQAKLGLADICISWVGVEAYEADDYLRKSLARLRPSLPAGTTSIVYR